jgi:hypothetical protein
MRANVNLDNDAYDFASAYATAKGIPLGAAISELLLRAEQKTDAGSESRRLKRSSRGYLVRARTGKVVTSETVKRASEDDV